VEYAECTYHEGIVVVVLPCFSELFAPKEDFAKVPVIVQIIHFPPLNKPNFGRLCHYCATKNGSKQHKNKV
jgi:hypothetical protein